MKRFTLALAMLFSGGALAAGVTMPVDLPAGSDTIPMEVESIEVDEAVGTSAQLPVYAGYEADWQQAHDEMIVRVVEAFNAEHGWQEGDDHWLDPAVVKAWALQESGGHQDIFTSGDMMQMNNGGDWAPEKVHVGVHKGQRLNPEESLEAALKWAYQKGEETRPASQANGDDWYPAVRDGETVNGYASRFVSWDRAITRYNGGGVADYLGDIERRMQAVA